MKRRGETDASHRARSWTGPIGVAAAAALSLVPLVGVVLLALRRLGRLGAEPGRRGWALAWWLALAPLALVSAVHGVATASLPHLAVTVVLIGVVAPLATLRRRALVSGAMVALAALAIGGGVERLAAERTLHDRTIEPDLDVRRVSALLRGVERIDVGDGRVLDRAWRAVGPVSALSVSLEVRRVGAADEAVDEPPMLWLGVAPERTGPGPWVETALPLSDEWRGVTRSFAPTELAGADGFRTTVRLVGGGAVELRRVAVAADGVAASPLPLRPRQRLWFGGPNLLGHVTAMTGVAAIATAAGPVGVVGAIAFAGTALALTGSRTATAVFVAFALLLIAVRLPARRRWLIAVAVVAVVALAALLDPADLGRLGRWTLDDDNLRSRAVEMNDAWQALVAAPLRGAGEGNLPTLAHNMWLQVGGEFGLPGLLAALWWSAAALLVGGRRAGAGGALVVAAYLALQLSDESWRYPGVFAPMLVAVGALWLDRAAGAAAAAPERATPAGSVLRGPPG